jgi:hypothetical protein
MSAPKLIDLRERLLVAGVAPRHVRRYLRELSEHHDDARRAELARGLDEAAADAAAWARLGSEDSLAQSMLARPELRSKGARFPALVFGLGPVLTWLGIVVATAALARLLSAPAGVDHAVEVDKPAGWQQAALAFCMLYVRVFPVVLGVVVLLAAARRRLPVYWPLAGSALVNVLAGTLTVQFMGATAIGVNSSLLPWVAPFSDFGPRDFVAFAEGLARAAGMLAVSAIVYRASARRWAA